jgi:hypothetical protein
MSQIKGKQLKDKSLSPNKLQTGVIPADVVLGSDLVVDKLTTAETTLVNKRYVDAQIAAADTKFEGAAGEGLVWDETNNEIDIATGGVVTTMIADGNVTNDKIADATISVAKLASVNVADGLLQIGNDGKIAEGFLPSSIVGQVEYISVITAAGAALLPAAGSTNKGHYYIASEDFDHGTYTAATGNGFKVGDWIISDGATWAKVDNTDAVSTVHGRTGSIVAVKGDYKANLVDFIPVNGIDATDVQAAIEEINSDIKALETATVTNDVKDIQTVASLAIRNAIPANNRRAGMQVIVNNTGATSENGRYMLNSDLTTWSSAMSFGTATASGSGAFAASNSQTTASGTNSVAFGGFTIASNSGAFAIGSSTTASGSNSRSSGLNSTASGTASVASGEGASNIRVVAAGRASFNHSRVSSNSATNATGVGSQADNAAILGGLDHRITGGAASSAILGGAYHHIDGSQLVAIIGGGTNKINTGSERSAIIGGLGNTVSANVTNSVIVGGSGITATISDTVYMPNAYVTNLTPTTNNHLTSKQYVDNKVSSSALIQEVHIEATGGTATGTGIKVYTGTFTLPAGTAKTDAALFVNGMRIQMTEFAFFAPAAWTTGNTKFMSPQATTDKLFFDLTALGYEIEADDVIEFTYNI